MGRTHIVTADPEILTQRIDPEWKCAVEKGEEEAELKAVQFRTDEGNDVTLERGIDLFNTNGHIVGTITLIWYSETANQTKSHSTDWKHTIRIDYVDDTAVEGGVPLGELAMQWNEGELTTIREALAEHGNRKLMLWELAANGRDFCGVQFTAKELGIEDKPVTKQVEAFKEDMLKDGEVRPEYDEGTNWDYLESTYGDIADLYL